MSDFAIKSILAFLVGFQWGYLSYYRKRIRELRQQIVRDATRCTFYHDVRVVDHIPKNVILPAGTEIKLWGTEEQEDESDE